MIKFNYSSLQREKELGIAILTAAVLLTCPACSIRVPSVPEQQALQEMGAFPGGLPAWIASTPSSAKPKILSGIIPTKFAISRTQPKAEETAPISARKEGEDSSRQGSSKQEPKVTVSTPSRVEDNSVGANIKRIEHSCPYFNNSFTESISSGDSEQRVIAYEQLAKKCETSAEIWLLLGKEYLVDGRLTQSEQAIQRAVGLDASNLDAVMLLEKLKKTKPVK